jgi:hypothetical protein
MKIVEIIEHQPAIFDRVVALLDTATISVVRGQLFIGILHSLTMDRTAGHKSFHLDARTKQGGKAFSKTYHVEDLDRWKLTKVGTGWNLSVSA